MKNKSILFGILLLSILIFSMTTATSATIYTIGVKPGDKYTWEIKTLDPSFTEEPSGAEVGDRATMIINNVEETSPAWKITNQFTNFDGITSTKTDSLSKDPHLWSFSLISALPVNEYLTEAFGSEYVSGNKIIISSPYYTALTYSVEIVYDTSTGIVSSTKYSRGSTVMYEVVLVPAIPGYELPILLGITVISTLGLIYLIMNKK